MSILLFAFVISSNFLSSPNPILSNDQVPPFKKGLKNKKNWKRTIIKKRTVYLIHYESSYLQGGLVFEYQKPFEETDLLDIKGRIKYMNIRNVLKMRASHKTKEEAKRIYLLAINRFKESLESDPNNKNSLRNIGDCYMQIDNNEDAKFY